MINDGDYITFAQGNAGLKFTPDADRNTAATFDVESSEDGSTVAAQSGTATSTITITPRDHGGIGRIGVSAKMIRLYEDLGVWDSAKPF